MKTLYLIRHSLTEANEKRLYCGHTNLSLTENGRAHALSCAKQRPLPALESYATSGMKRADETLLLLTGISSREVIPSLMEMNFGAFEMHSYEQLLNDPDYIRWIEDNTGDTACPGGESANSFKKRVTECADAIIARPSESLLIVCHGGVIANIMQYWFSGENKNFYQWQPGACGGYAIEIACGKPARYAVL